MVSSRACASEGERRWTKVPAHGAHCQREGERGLGLGFGLKAELFAEFLHQGNYLEYL